MPEIMTATQLIHAAAGSPPYPADVAGHCRLCGAEGSGLPFAEWVKPTFTNWDLLRPGTIVCTACQFCTEHTSALLQARTGKDKPQRMVNYSHFVVGSEWLPLHKGQKAQMLAALRSSPAVAVIAVSGQKHLCFRARPGWWQIEELAARPDLARLEACLAPIQALYRIFSKEEIAAETYAPHRMAQYAAAYGMADLLAAQQVLRPHRGAQMFDLALYLAQKEADDGVERVPAAVSPGAAAADPALARAGQRLQEQVRAQHLDTVGEQHQERGLHGDGQQVLQQSLWQAADRA